MKASLKKNILIGIALTAGILLLGALGWFLYFKAQFSVYQDAKYKFSIKYPKTWRVIVHPAPNVAVAFLRPKDTALDTIQENFNVTIQPVPDDIEDLAAFSARIKRQMIGMFGKNINIVEDKQLHWDWREGHMIAIDEPKPLPAIKLVNAWVLRSDQAYILTFLGELNKYPQDGIYVNEMIHSLQLQ